MSNTEDEGEKIPEIKKNISSYLKDEEGEISKHHMVAIGAFLATLAFLDFMPEVAADHTNGFGISWDSGVIYPEHSHHVSAVL
ncbi:MAG: hypothetical protein ACLFSS_04155 [Candidatus Aenigmatarchaeota archaeon]